MTKVKLPDIPKGNLGKIYVLSEKAATELFKESGKIIEEVWPFPKAYKVPSREDITVILESSPHLWLPIAYGKEEDIGTGSFGMAIPYRHTNSHGGGLHSGLGVAFLEFLCSAIRNYKEGTRYPNNPNRLIAPNSHIFVYNMFKPDGINLPLDVFKYKIVEPAIAEELNIKTKKAFDEISDKIREVIERRSAALTRGFLNDQFVI